MATDRQISELKTRICREIMRTPAIVDAIQPDDPTEDLMYQYIFPTFRRPDTEQEKRTTICMRVNTYAKSGNNNDLVKTMRFIIYIITHDDLQRVDSGIAQGCTRCDYIADQIEILFNRNPMGLVKARFVSNVEEQVDARHPMRTVVFEADGWNTAGCAT